jgi:hypothetical protein
MQIFTEPDNNPPEVRSWRIQRRTTPGMWASAGSKSAVMWWPSTPTIRTTIRRHRFRWEWRITAFEQRGQYPEDIPGNTVLAERTGMTWRQKDAYAAVRQHRDLVEMQGSAALGGWPTPSWTEDI